VVSIDKGGPLCSGEVAHLGCVAHDRDQVDAGFARLKLEVA